MMSAQLRLSRRALAPILAAAAVATLAVPSLARASSPASRDGSASPRSLVLHAKDLPASFGKGFKEGGLTIDNVNAAGADHVTLATISSHGRVTGYQMNLAMRAATHYVAILNNVDLYRSAAGAHWQYQRYHGVSPAPAHAQRLNVSGIGDEAWGYTYFGPGGGTAEVYFRRGQYDARIYILTFYGTLQVGDILQLARTLDGRIKSAR